MSDAPEPTAPAIITPEPKPPAPEPPIIESRMLMKGKEKAVWKILHGPGPADFIAYYYIRVLQIIMNNQPIEVNIEIPIPEAMNPVEVFAKGAAFADSPKGQEYIRSAMNQMFGPKVVSGVGSGIDPRTLRGPLPQRRVH